MKTLLNCLALGLVVALVPSSAQAKFFVGASHDITDFANGSEVSTRGTLIDAVNLLNDTGGVVDGPGISTTINGVLFKGTQPGQFHEGAESFAEASFVYHGGPAYADSGLWSSGGAYDTLADSQIYDTDNGSINYGDGFGVVNLIPGQLYELQVFMLDDRSGINKTFPLQFQMVQFTGSADEFVQVPVENQPAAELAYMDGITIGGNGLTQANGEIATVTFSIDAPFNGIFVNTWNGGSYSGMQLRSVTLPGDLDADNDVDGEDFLSWQRGLGSPYTAADLTAIKQFYGTVLSTPVAGSVPEPATATLMCLAALVAQRVSRSRRRQNAAV